MNGIRSKLILFTTLTVIVALLNGCSTAKTVKRGKLSDVMEKSSNKYEGKREVEVDGAKETYYEKDIYIASNKTIRKKAPGTDKKDLRDVDDEILKDMTELRFGLNGGTGLIMGDDFHQIKHGSLSLGLMMEERAGFRGSAGVGWAPVEKTSRLNQSIDNDVVIWNLGIDLKYHFSPYTEPMSVYAIIGRATTYMMWDYENDIITSEGEHISSDALSGFDFHVGLGISIKRFKHINIGVEMVPSILFWDETTREGFDNDVFDPLICFRVGTVIEFF